MTGSGADLSSSAAWSQYWAGGRVSSCPGSDDRNYEGPVAECWQAFFQQAPATASLLDIACGNGAVLLLALEHTRRHRRDWQLVGVDLAELNHAAPAGEADVKLMGGVDMHHLPFKQASFDLAVSQFGLEYGRYPDNLREALRVLRPGGRYQFMLHSSGSPIGRRCRLQLDQIDRLVRRWELFQRLRCMLEAEASGRDIAAAKAVFDHAAAEAFTAIAAGRKRGNDISLLQQTMRQLGGIWQQRGTTGLEPSIHACEGGLFALHCLARRLRDQQQAVLDRSTVQAWREQLLAYDAAPEVSTIRTEGEEIGWLLRGRKG